MSLAYPLHTKRPRITTWTLSTAVSFLDEVAPVLSGRNFRILSMTDSFLYNLYRTANADGLGKTTFLNKVVYSSNIHHSSVPQQCIYCCNCKPSSKKGYGQGLEQHKQRAKVMQSAFVNMKRSLTEQENMVLVVQDFTQIRFGSKLCQDLIICIYFGDPLVEQKVSHTFHHFIAEHSNDVDFVVSVWTELLEELYSTWPNCKLAIWSDGGRKHFKQSTMIHWWWQQVQKSKKSVEFYFFESYHGSSSCDAAASHAKSTILRFQKNFNTIITDINKLVEVVNTLQQHEAVVFNNIPSTKDQFKVKTIKGISKAQLIKFNFNGFIELFDDVRDTQKVQTISVQTLA